MSSEQAKGQHAWQRLRAGKLCVSFGASLCWAASLLVQLGGWQLAMIAFFVACHV
jgi:hypothetical protein